MNRNDIVFKITEVISQIAGVFEDINESDRLKEDLGLDSLSIVSLIALLEDKFNIVFDDSDLDPELLTDVKSIADLSEKYL